MTAHSLWPGVLSTRCRWAGHVYAVQAAGSMAMPPGAGLCLIVAFSVSGP
jgi:hypothetical protein